MAAGTCAQRRCWPSTTKNCDVRMEGWRQRGLAEWEQTQGKKTVKVCLDIDRPSHGGLDLGIEFARGPWVSSRCLKSPRHKDITIGRVLYSRLYHAKSSENYPHLARSGIQSAYHGMSSTATAINSCTQ